MRRKYSEVGVERVLKAVLGSARYLARGYPQIVASSDLAVLDVTTALIDGSLLPAANYLLMLMVPSSCHVFILMGPAHFHSTTSPTGTLLAMLLWIVNCQVGLKSTGILALFVPCMECM